MKGLFYATSMVAMAAMITSCGNGGAKKAAADSTAMAADSNVVVLFDGTSLDGWRGYNKDTIPSAWTLEVPDTPSYYSAPEYQILDNENHPDAKLGVDGNRKSASLYDMIPAKPQNSKPFGEWNTGKIMVYKGTVVHYQNGENVLEYHLWTPEWQAMLDKSKFSKDKNEKAYNLLLNCGGDQKEGYIGLQDHGDDVWYRNITVKKLD